MPIFDLKKNLVFVCTLYTLCTLIAKQANPPTKQYGAYHRDPTNVAIHITCVPVLLATAFLFVCARSYPIATP
jgi:hypothetical protein